MTFLEKNFVSQIDLLVGKDKNVYHKKAYTSKQLERILDKNRFVFILKKKWPQDLSWEEILKIGIIDGSGTFIYINDQCTHLHILIIFQDLRDLIVYIAKPDITNKLLRSYNAHTHNSQSHLSISALIPNLPQTILFDFGSLQSEDDEILELIICEGLQMINLQTSFVGMEDRYKTGTILIETNINKDIKISSSKIDFP